MENEREVLVEVNHLNVTYGSGKKAYEAVQDANFKIYKGETFGLVGESGSGKTTIGRAILRILHTSGGSRGKTLDPAQADDLSSRKLTGAIYDTLLQYDYLARPYRLIPSMLAEMPVGDATHDRYWFRLRNDLRFADDPVFAGLPDSARRITSDDVL